MAGSRMADEYVARAALASFVVCIVGWLIPGDAAGGISFLAGFLTIIFVGAFALMTKR